MEVKKLNRLKVVMAEKDLSNIWLSEKLGVSQATVSKWMTNFSQPNLETLIKISKHSLLSDVKSQKHKQYEVI